MAISSAIDATHFLQFTFNRLRYTGYTNNVVPFSNGFAGAETNKQSTRCSRTSAAAPRSELNFGNGLTGVLGIGGEVTRIRAFSNNYTYRTARAPLYGPLGIGIIPVDQSYGNVAPEAALRWRLIRSGRFEPASPPAMERPTQASFS